MRRDHQRNGDRFEPPVALRRPVAPAVPPPIPPLAPRIVEPLPTPSLRKEIPSLDERFEAAWFVRGELLEEEEHVEEISDYSAYQVFLESLARRLG